VNNALGENTTWTYDTAGRVYLQTFASGMVADHDYDTRGRLTGIQHRTSGGTVRHDEDYVYDAASRMTSKTVNTVTTSYTYDDLGQLLSESSPSHTINYTYDANGNRATRVVTGGVSETYTYDSGDKLESVVWTGGRKDYTYDDAGLRRGRARDEQHVQAGRDQRGRAGAGRRLGEAYAYSGTYAQPP
jgi:YD repeat-containing protein